jgi:hypothetical protein
MICCKKLEKLVSTIKKFKVSKILKIIALGLFFIPSVFALSPENEKQMYLGCYADSKQYIVPERAKEYCSCTIQMLVNAYSNKEIEKIFKKKPEEIVKATEFSPSHCENNKEAIK